MLARSERDGPNRLNGDRCGMRAERTQQRTLRSEMEVPFGARHRVSAEVTLRAELAALRFEKLQIVDRRLSPTRAGGDDEGSSQNARAVHDQLQATKCAAVSLVYGRLSQIRYS